MSVSSKPAPKKRSRRQKAANEMRLLRRDGIVKYVRVLRALRRFHRSVRRAEDSQASIDQ